MANLQLGFRDLRETKCGKVFGLASLAQEGTKNSWPYLYLPDLFGPSGNKDNSCCLRPYLK